MNKVIEIALSQYGTKEISGNIHNKSIVNYSKESGFNWVNDDETPWCSIFVNWVCMKAGLERTKSARAKSWLEIGEKTNKPELGDIVVLKKGNSYHVTFFVNGINNTLYCLGGNQSNEVNISKYNTAEYEIEHRKLKSI